jgi:hypothetical protein
VQVVPTAGQVGTTPQPHRWRAITSVADTLVTYLLASRLARPTIGQVPENAPKQLVQVLRTGHVTGNRVSGIRAAVPSGFREGSGNLLPLGGERVRVRIPLPDVVDVPIVDQFLY